MVPGASSLSMILKTTHRLDPSKLGTIRTLVLFEEQASEVDGPVFSSESDGIMGVEVEVEAVV
jgi:hypothetical protein